MTEPLVPAWQGEAAPSRLGRRRAAWVVNIALRVLIVAFAAEAVLAGDDPRFTGKGIQVRDIVLAGAAVTMIFPSLHAVRRGRRPYPVLADCLLLSILALDMAGNSLNLYEQGWRFDLIPHAYGPAAGTLAIRLVGPTWMISAAVVNGLHVLLEGQEALGDAVFGTHNVHGTWDTASDLLAGFLGSVAVALMGWRHRRVDRVPSAARLATPLPPAD